MVYQLTAFYKEPVEFLISETEYYNTLEEAERAKERWLEDDDIEEVIVEDEPVEQEILVE